MELCQCRILPSPTEPGKVRLSGIVSYDDAKIEPEEYWFEVSPRYADALSDSGNPWLACLAPLAVTLREPLRLCKPVDALLYENIQELMRVWRWWYPHLHLAPVPLQAETMSHDGKGGLQRTAAFFSGGVDSFFTVLRHGNGASLPKGDGIDELLTIWGFDIPIDKPQAFQRKVEGLRATAHSMGKLHIEVATNLRKTRWNEVEWGPRAHGAGLAAVALSLEKRFQNVLIPASHKYNELQPWGSHPLTDPLFSTRDTRIVHDGAGFSRVEKTEYISSSEAALQCLHVCWKLRSGDNCCSCSKCYRTMATLFLLGVLDKSPTFNKASFDIARLARVYSVGWSDRSFFEEIATLAQLKGRADVEASVERGLRYSRRLDTFLPLVDRMRRTRFLRRLGVWCRSMLLRRVIC